MFGSCSSSSCGSRRFEAFLDERGQVELAVFEGGDHHVAEVVEVLLTFAGAEVDAEVIGVDGAQYAGIVHRLPGGADGELRVPAALLPNGRVFADIGERPIANFGRDACGKVTGVEERGVVDARLALFQVGPELRHGGAQGSYDAHSGYNNSSSHGVHLINSEDSPQRHEEHGEEFGTEEQRYQRRVASDHARYPVVSCSIRLLFVSSVNSVAKKSNCVLLKKMRVVFDLQAGAVGLGADIEDSYDADPGAEVVCIEQDSAAGVFGGIGIVAGEENIG